ncbi:MULTISPECIES: hypothetical protein [unclassified Streptomyces]|uniref:hypothetical protein n=1 Tax=unclassified Streptomyces TaxID=2593676 RepID=UPI00344F9E70
MNKSQLVQAAVRKAAEGGQELGPEDTERVIDALFGTVERAGAIAEALRDGATVTVGSFGRFRGDSGSAVFEEGAALSEYLHGTVRERGRAPS